MIDDTDDLRKAHAALELGERALALIARLLRHRMDGEAPPGRRAEH